MDHIGIVPAFDAPCPTESSENIQLHAVKKNDKQVETFLSNLSNKTNPRLNISYGVVITVGANYTVNTIRSIWGEFKTRREYGTQVCVRVFLSGCGKYLRDMSAAVAEDPYFEFAHASNSSIKGT